MSFVSLGSYFRPVPSELFRGQGAGMAGRYSGSYLDRWNEWRIVAIPADIGQASLVDRIPTNRIPPTRRWVETGAKVLGMSSISGKQ